MLQIWRTGTETVVGAAIYPALIRKEAALPTKQQSANPVLNPCGVLDATCPYITIGTHSFTKIIGFSKADAMAIYKELLLVVAAVNCLNIDLHQRNLAEIPSNINPGVTTLNLVGNKIKGVSATSLVTFPDLLKLLLAYNDIRYISEEAFDHNPKLSKLHLQGKRIDSMTSSFGVAHDSLTVINVRGALTQEGKHTSNFSRCVKLQKLDIGYNGYRTLDASILPHNLIELNMIDNDLDKFPDLTLQTPYVKKVILQGNSISSIPKERIQGLKYLEKLYIAGNHIQILPGLMETSIKEIQSGRNPFICNSSVCDLRMLHDLGILVVLDEPVCEAPEAYQGQRILAMNISTLACPGKCIAPEDEVDIESLIVCTNNLCILWYDYSLLPYLRWW